MKKNWLQKNYKIGESVQAPHPREDRMETAIVTNFTMDTIHTFSGGPTGIMVRFDDGVFVEIAAGYLNENGGGVI